MSDFILQYLPAGLSNKAVWYSAAVAALFIALEAKINTKNIVKVAALFAACVGALIYANGTPNVVFWVGLVIFILTLLNDLVDYCRAKHADEDLERRNDA